MTGIKKARVYLGEAGISRLPHHFKAKLSLRSAEPSTKRTVYRGPSRAKHRTPTSVPPLRSKQLTSTTVDRRSPRAFQRRPGSGSAAPSDNKMPAELNIDVYRVILTYCTNHSVSVVMKTCHTLYHEGAIELCRRPVDITDEDRLLSFLLFINAESRSRCSRLRILRLHLLTISRDAAEQLLTFIPEMKRLRELTLTDAEALLTILPPLGDAFAALDAILYLEFGTVGEATYSMIQKIRSPIRRLSMCSARYPSLFPDPVDPVDLVAHLSSSLEELSCSNWSHQQSDTSYARFLKLRRFEVGPVSLPNLARYHSAFPNLEEMTMHALSSSFYNVEEHRAENAHSIAEQAVGHGLGIWPSLRRFTTDGVQNAYAVCLTSQVESLHLGVVGNSEWLAAILADARPTYLSLTPMSLGMRHVIGSTFADVFRSPACMTNLRSLDLTWKEPDPKIELKEVFEELFAAMSGLHIKDLTIRLKYFNFAEDVKKTGITAQDKQDAGFRPFQVDVAAPGRTESFSMRGKARQFLDHTLQAVPSLEDVTLYLSNHYEDKRDEVFSLTRPRS